MKLVYRAFFAALLAVAGSTHAQSSRPGLGALPYGSGIAFRVWAPFAESAAVAGEFNEWRGAPMARDAAGGTWSLDVPGARVGQRYKYVFNGTIWKRDPRARQVNHSNGDSVVYDPAAFDWGADRPPAIPRNDLVIYEMHVGTSAAGRRPPPSTTPSRISITSATSASPPSSSCPSTNSPADSAGATT